MKKLLAIFLVLTVLLCLASCGANTELGASVGGSAKPSASNYPKNILMADRKDTSTACVFENENYSRTEIASVSVLDTLANKPADAWDVSDEKNGTVWAWVDEGMNLFIAGEGGVTAKSCTKLFAHYESATAFHFDGNFYTDITKDVYGMFLYCKKLETIDLNSWNVSNVTNFSELFYGCHKLRTVKFDTWDTSNAQAFGTMFNGCVKLEQVDVSHFNTENASSLGGMFWGCENLTSVGDLSGWNVSNVKFFKWMFASCYSLTSVGDLSGWDTSSATSMFEMFSGCKSLSTVGDLKIPADCDTKDMYAYTNLQ